MKIIAVLVSVFLWGLRGFANKQAVARAHVVTVQRLYCIPFALSIPGWYWLGARVAPGASLDRGAVFWSMISALSSLLAFATFLFALRDEQASWVVAVAALYPVVTLVLLVLTGQEQLRPMHGAGVLVGLIVFQLGGRP